MYKELLKHKNEVIKPLKGFESRYLISNYGRLFSINGRFKGIRELIPSLGKIKNKFSYYVYMLRDKKNGIKSKQIRAHQLVAENFIEKPIIKDKLCVNHKDGNKLNNHVSNLEWVTYLENSKHAIKNKLHDTKGEKHQFSKLTRQEVLKAFELRKQGFTHEKIAAYFNYKVDRRHMTDILNKKCWGWLHT